MGEEEEKEKVAVSAAAGSGSDDHDNNDNSDGGGSAFSPPLVSSSLSSPQPSQPSSRAASLPSMAPMMVFLLRSRDGRPSGQAYACFESAEAAEAVARACDHEQCGERYIEVFWVRKRTRF